ncbi:hypothetical protein FTO74_17740 [Granulicella sp. WH15]|uniref:hypothetical protein n=1 Tax=Granulicella sp. WH15 TaxID=2602070 RepID=UPI0013679238|nr:hypothetical protein [Granulicella sp. WH15]QHN04993.1 hypothetical protein FTO74_17740 [Granulicella sp. WH15]
MRHLLSSLIILLAPPLLAQSIAADAELRLQIVSSTPGPQGHVPAVAWLEPLAGTPTLPFPPHGRYTLLQENRMFSPHLQVIPVGSSVQFPNADPFFHNVFSLFDGRRFDLGLYEAGSSKSVTFPREGASYIFCNIHPEMSAVVLSLSTPLYAIADARDTLDLHGIPSGDYKLHLWIEGLPQPVLSSLERHLHLSSGLTNLGEIKAPIPRTTAMKHSNKFGATYDTTPKTPY